MPRLDEIKKRTEAATKGPWHAEKNLWRNDDSVFVRTEDGKGILPMHEKNDDAQFIAHAREDIPWLIAELEKLQVYYALGAAKRDELRAELKKLQKEIDDAEDIIEVERFFPVGENIGASDHASNSNCQLGRAIAGQITRIRLAFILSHARMA